MSLLASLTTDESIQGEKDSLGGIRVLDSGIYDFTVDMAHIVTAGSGAMGLALTLKSAKKEELKQTLWMTSGKDKGSKNYFEKDGQKSYLPGFLLANALCLLAAGKEIKDMDIEKKTIKLWSSDAKAEVPTQVDVLVDLLDKPIIAGVIKQKVDKTKKNDTTGKYDATGETREENDIDKFFRAKDKKTTTEILAQAEEAAFIHSWADRWTGQVKDKSTKNGNTGTAGMPLAARPAAARGKPTSSLFG